ncbi:MAG TPA: polysaccharide biosynthesis/export family protein [Opitutaceae bacterium]
MPRFLPRSFLPLFTVFSLAGLVFAARASAQGTDAATATEAAYVISLTDRIRIEVFGEDDLGTIARVDSKGTVNLKLVGEVRIAGLNVSEAQRAIETAYRDGRYLRSPQVTINVEEYAPREVIVQGEVRQPGRYNLPVEASWTVVDLISKAQGFTDIARGNSVTVSRTGPDGRRQVFTIDAESIIKGKRGTKDGDSTIKLQPGDVINVPQRLF